LGPPARSWLFPLGSIPGAPLPQSGCNCWPSAPRSPPADRARQTAREPSRPHPLPSDSGRGAGFLCAFGHLAATGRAYVVDSVVTGPGMSERVSVAGFPVTTGPHHPAALRARCSRPGLCGSPMAVPKHDQFPTGPYGPPRALGAFPLKVANVRAPSSFGPVRRAPCLAPVLSIRAPLLPLRRFHAPGTGGIGGPCLPKPPIAMPHATGNPYRLSDGPRSWKSLQL
jgi:hypothetical protein